MKTKLSLCTALFAAALVALPAAAAEAVAGAATTVTGVWKWTTTNRNGQPQENTLRLDVGKDGAITGTFSDRSGTLPITNAVLKGDQFSFSTVREIPGGKIETNYAGQLAGERLSLTSERPDFAPAALAQGKKIQVAVTAARTSKTPDIKPAFGSSTAPKR